MAAPLVESGNSTFSSNISGIRVVMNELKNYYKAKLFAFLNECSGNKILILDEEIIGPFGLLCDIASLEDHDVQKRMYALSIRELPKDPENRHIIFLVRPAIQLMKHIADLITQEDKYGTRGVQREFHILFMPEKSELCIKKLTERNVLGAFTNIESFPAHLLPLDSDLLSMNYSECTKEIFLTQDLSSMHDVANSIMTLQSVYGIIPNLYCKGTCAKRVYEIMMRLRRERRDEEEQITPRIDNLILIDRSCDLLTPFLSQLTYEGFIDEIFNIKINAIKVPADRLPSNEEQRPQSAEDKKVVLNSSDQLYSELRDRNFNAVGPKLSAKAKDVSAKYEERNEAKSIGELRQFVSKLPQMQAERASVATQTAIAQMVKEYIASESFKDGLFCQQELRIGLDADKMSPYIDDCISRSEPLNKVLRLIAVQSYCAGGLKPQVLQFYKTAIVQVYGYESMVLLSNMEKARFIKLQSPYSKTYSTLKKNLNLIVEDVDEQNPSDIAYVYSGYAPVSVRLIQNALKPGWRTLQNSLQLLPGPMLEEKQQLPTGVRKRRASVSSSTSSGNDSKSTTLVFFLGGVTYAEIAALRFLQQSDHPTDYIIATTHITNGDRFIDSISTVER